MSIKTVRTLTFMLVSFAAVTSSLVFMLIQRYPTILDSLNSLDDSSGLAEYLVTFATPMLAFLITLCSIASDGCLLVLPCLASLAAVLLVKASQVLTTVAHSHLLKTFDIFNLSFSLKIQPVGRCPSEVSLQVD